MFEAIPAAWLPAIIFFARICDVSMGTLRIVYVSRGMKGRAAILGFIEVLIWIIVVAQLIQHLNNWINFVAYAGGFSVGTFLGMAIENKLQVGTLIVRIITAEDPQPLVDRLKEAGFMLTRVEASGGLGPVQIIFSVVRRKRWKEVKNIIESFDPKAFYSVEDVKYASADDNGRLVDGSRSSLDRLLRVRKGI